MAKQYGLILPDKHQQGHQIGQITSNKPSVFDEDSDSDTPQFKPTGLCKGPKKQDKINQNKALEEDPTVYQYDELYDEMDKKRKETKLSRKDLDKKPKYINRLLAAAEKRKIENERRIERQIQKEREEEGDMYKDKESFITAAYKKKLEEMKAIEEQEKREEYLEEIGDVRKQCNLDGFYRHLYEQKVKYDDAEVVKVIKEKHDNVVSDDGCACKRSRTSSESASEIEVKPKAKRDMKKREYRKRRESHESEDEQEDKKEHLVSNLDADSDFSIDSSDSESENEDHEKINKEIKKEKPENNSSNPMSGQENKESKMDIAGKTEIVKEKGNTNGEGLTDEKLQEAKPKKPKLDIWKKRTVGEKFDEAVKRYFERKALREAQKSI